MIQVSKNFKMSAFNGKWRFVRTDENCEKFNAAVKAAPEYTSLLEQLAAGLPSNPNIYVEELKVDKAAGTVQRIVYINGKAEKDAGPVKFDTEVDGMTYGKPAKLKVTLESDTKLKRTEVGSDFTATVTLEVNGDELTLTSVSGGVTSVDKYARV